MATLQQQLNSVNEEIDGIMGLYPNFSNETEESTLDPEAKPEFCKFMNLKVSKIDLIREIKRAESRQNQPPRSTRTNGLAVRGLNLNPSFQRNSEPNSGFFLPRIQRLPSEEMSTLTLSPVSDSGSVHSIRSGSQSPPPDFV